MYKEDQAKQGINLTWKKKALTEYTSVMIKSESCPIFLLYFFHHSSTWQAEVLLYYLYIPLIFICAWILFFLKILKFSRQNLIFFLIIFLIISVGINFLFPPWVLATPNLSLCLANRAVWAKQYAMSVCFGGEISGECVVLAAKLWIGHRVWISVMRCPMYQQNYINTASKTSPCGSRYLALPN